MARYNLSGIHSETQQLLLHMLIGSGAPRMSSKELWGSISSCHNGSWSPG